MEVKGNLGEYSKSFITDIPADLESEESLYYKKTIPRFPEEAVYVYSFKEGKMIYADGWEDILGYKDEEINMLLLVNSTAPEHIAFSYELNDKALKFIHARTEDLEKYSFSLEVKKIHKDGSLIPLIWKVNVFRSENGRITEILGRSQINRGLKFGNVIRYGAHGPDRSSYEEELNKALFRHFAISDKEKEALSLVAKGYSFKEIANVFKISQSAVEKRIIPMYKRFDVKSLTHLVSFAYDNHILP